MGSTISTFVFQPPTPPSYNISETNPYFFITTKRKQRIPIFFINNKAAYTILFSHGNAEDIGFIYEWFHMVSYRLKINILAYEYTGYGHSEGRECSEESCYADIEAAFDYLTIKQNISHDRIIAYGRSLGSGPSIYLASIQSKKGKPIGGVILQSPMLSIYRVLFHFRFTLFGDMFCNIDLISTIESPITVIHGTNDEIVPFFHGQELFLSCNRNWRGNPLWVEKGGHNNIEIILSEDDILFQFMEEFIYFCEKSNNYRTKTKIIDTNYKKNKEFLKKQDEIFSPSLTAI